MYGDSFPMLNNMKVIELDGYLPVRFFGKTLLDFGADVFSINSTSQVIQRNKLSYRLNKGKKIINLDFSKSENGLKLFHKLIEKADVLLDTQEKGFLEKLNIDKDQLLSKYPKLIIIFLSGYGIAENNSKIPAEPTAKEIKKYFSMNSLKKIFEFFKNKENSNNKYINPLIILGDLFGGCIMPLYELSQALISRRKSGKGCVLNSVITANLFSLSIISDKLCDSNKFHFSCNTKNLDYVLFSVDLTKTKNVINADTNKNLKNNNKKANEKEGNSDENTNLNAGSENGNLNNNLYKQYESILHIKNNTNSNNNSDIHKDKYDFIMVNNHNSEKLNYQLKKICERLLIEVLNLEELPEGLRLNLTRDYIDYFQLITKSLNDSVKYIKDLCKLLEKEEILKQLRKFDFLEIYPVIQFRELMQYFKYSNILKGDNIINSFTDEQPQKPSNINKPGFNSKKIFGGDEKNGNNFFEDTVVNLNSNLKVFGINDKDLNESDLLATNNKKEFKPKL